MCWTSVPPSARSAVADLGRCQNREVAVQGLAQERGIEAVPVVVRRARLGAARGTVERGIDVSSSGEHQAIEARECGDILGRFKYRRQPALCGMDRASVPAWRFRNGNATLIMVQARSLYQE